MEEGGGIYDHSRTKVFGKLWQEFSEQSLEAANVRESSTISQLLQVDLDASTVGCDSRMASLLGPDSFFTSTREMSSAGKTGLMKMPELIPTPADYPENFPSRDPNWRLALMQDRLSRKQTVCIALYL